MAPATSEISKDGDKRGLSLLTALEYVDLSGNNFVPEPASLLLASGGAVLLQRRSAQMIRRSRQG